ncbi:MAG: DUF5996 family protein [Bacteroidota bacterium]
MLKDISQIPLKGIEETKNTLHQAVQLIALVARHIRPRVEDDHYANLNWSPDRSAMLGNILELEGHNYRAGMQLSTLKIFILKDNNEVDHFSLIGKTYEEAFEILKEKWSRAGFDTGRFELELPYEIPTYPETDGVTFKIDNPKAAEIIIKCFDTTQTLLEKFKKQHEHVDQIKCWPHHFDLATLKTFPKKYKDASIGIGFSPGDESIKEPYFYVNCWPYPNSDSLEVKKLNYGSWNLERWVGTTLTYTQILKANNQQKAIQSYLEESYKPLKEFSFKASKEN